ncbi:MAG: hypothetical protein JO276_05135 [Sphingomonadaceae bacterium]|nr:hypothetical protein [Sphingomonadaceae bacterium]
MRRMLIGPIAGTIAAAFFVTPALAQPPAPQPARPGELVEEYAPAIDRAADAMMNLDVGPIVDAVDPYGRHHHRTLRDMARRNDPDFERRMHATIYGTAATMGRAADAFAAAEPALRRAFRQFEQDMAEAIAAPGAPPPPRGRYGAPPAPAPAAPPPPDGDDDPWGD